MFFRIILLCFCSMCFLRSFHVSSCDHHCADKPVFTPSRLVVKFGDPTSARCFACQRACLNNLFDLEKSVGSSAKNGTTISWTVDRMTEWDTSAQCYYNNGTGYQCCTFLPITVYQPPDNVAISFVNHTGPMFEGHQYTLQCTVQDVAPVENLTVTFYRGQTALSQQQSNYNTEKTPVNEIFTLDINATKEDDGVQYWCEAELQLGPEGPQQPPVEISPKLTATVNYLELTSTRLPPTTPTTRKTTTPTTRKTTTPTTRKTTTPTTRKTTTPTTRKTTTPTTRKTTTPTTRKTTTPTTRKTTTPTTRKTTTTPSSSASSKRVHWIIMCFMFEFSVLV